MKKAHDDTPKVILYRIKNHLLLKNLTTARVEWVRNSIPGSRKDTESIILPRVSGTRRVKITLRTPHLFRKTANIDVTRFLDIT